MTHAQGDRFDVYRERVRCRDGAVAEAEYRGTWEPLVARNMIYLSMRRGVFGNWLCPMLLQARDEVFEVKGRAEPVKRTFWSSARHASRPEPRRDRMGTTHVTESRDWPAGTAWWWRATR